MRASTRRKQRSARGSDALAAARAPAKGARRRAHVQRVEEGAQGKPGYASSDQRIAARSAPSSGMARAAAKAVTHRHVSRTALRCQAALGLRQ